ncbi:MAG: hypothetical protein LC105_06020 [Chitinophagales bacterium]|nr:hypothetical protein [Chitinophagales bacterium]
MIWIFPLERMGFYYMSKITFDDLIPSEKKSMMMYVIDNDVKIIKLKEFIKLELTTNH